MLTIPTANRRPESLTFSPDGRLLALGGVKDGLTVCDTLAGRVVGSLLLGAGYFGWDVGFTPDGRRVLNANGRFGWRAVDWTSGEAVRLGPGPPDSPTAMDRDGDWVVLATVVLPVTVAGPWRRVKLHAYRLTGGEPEPLWSVVTGGTLVPQVRAGRPGGDKTVSVEWRAPPAERLTDAPFLVVRGRAAGAVAAEAAVGAADTGPLAASPDGAWAAVVSGPRVLVWDLRDLSRKPRRFVVPSRKHTRCAAFSPDGRVLAAGGNDGLVTFWDPAGGRPVRSFDWSVGPVTAVGFSPDGLRCAACGGGGQVAVWDIDA